MKKYSELELTKSELFIVTYKDYLINWIETNINV